MINIPKTVKNYVLLTCLASVVACGEPAGSEYGMDGGSELTSIKMGVPAQSNFGPNGSKITAYHLRIAPEGVCDDGTRIDRVQAYGNFNLSESLKNGCDYTLTLSLGGSASDEASLNAPYYSTPENVRIPRTQLTGGTISVRVKLLLTEQGRAAGLPEKLVQQQNQDIQQHNNPQPQQEAVGAKFNLELRNAQGDDVNLRDEVKGELIMIDFAADYCGPCHAFARQVAGDQELKRLLATGKCSVITVLRGNLTTWRRNTGDAGLSHLYQPVNGFGEAARQLVNTSSFGTPFVGILKRDGTLVSSGNQEQLRAFKTRCAAL